MKTSQKGINLIKEFESLHDGDLSKIGLQPKLCPAGIWTVGFGRALFDPKTGQFLKGTKDKAKAHAMYPALTESQAEDMLREDLVRYEKKADRVLGVIKSRLNQNQYSAIVSFVYNVGDRNLASSTLLKKLAANPNDPTIKDEFLKWSKARVNGALKTLAGLLRRRKAEAELYFS